MSTSARPAFDTARLVDAYDLRFDADDRANGSLYVCTPCGGPAPERLIDTLRAAGLWSRTAYKTVADEQRQAYRDGLRFVAAVAYDGADGEVVLARFDHPKYPSDATRWAAWLACCDEHFVRQD
jgi:hypothetical protein